MSKIYEALKRAEQERQRAAARTAVGGRTGPVVPTGIPLQAEDGALEDYKRIRASLVSVVSPDALHTIMVTAARHGEGVSTVAVGLASVLAKDPEARVLLLEGNMRMPSLARLLSITPSGTLGEFMSGRLSAEAVITRVEPLNLSTIVAGNGGERGLDLERVSALLVRLRPQYDFIIIDAPPVNRYSDASILAPRVDGVILIVEADRTPVTEAEAAKRQLDRVDARILGVVLNRRRSYIPAFLESLL